MSTESLPSWERGLKYDTICLLHALSKVAPLVGAWIEIIWTPTIQSVKQVAPLVGAWIEMDGEA